MKMKWYNRMKIARGNGNAARGSWMIRNGNLHNEEIE